MERKAVVVPEDKRKIEKIKKKYNNPNMTDEVANKIIKLEVTSNVLKTATFISGVITTFDWLIPDNIPFLDEIVLTGLTALLSSGTKIVDKKIDDLAKTGSTRVEMNDISDLSSKMKNLKDAVVSSRSKS